MAYIETKLESATAKIATLRATKFKGVPKRPKANTMNACALSAARLAFESGLDYYVLPTFGGITISPNADAKATYNIGQGLRITAAGEIYNMKLNLG